MNCPGCGFDVIAHGLNEHTVRAGIDVSREDVTAIEVLKCPVSDHWHIVREGGTGQLDMYKESA